MVEKSLLEEHGDDPGSYADEIHAHDLVLGRMLGSGTTAQVFLGLWRGKAVAVKQLSSACLKECERISFQREVSILANVKHQNIVRLFGYSLSSQPCHLVSEYCEGGTLFELLHERLEQDLALAQQLKICGDVGAAVDYLHKFAPQIIHRDLKSLNLLLAKELKSLRDIPNVKVADFGLARVLEPKASGVALTKFVGTVHWMAPEMFTSSHYDEKVDVYSFGIVLFEMFAREPPFEDKTSEDIEQYVKRGGRPDTEALPRELPAKISDVMVTSWAQDPRDRPSFDVILKMLSTVSCKASVAPRRGSVANANTRGFLSKTRAVGSCEARLVSL